MIIFKNGKNNNFTWDYFYVVAKDDPTKQSIHHFDERDNVETPDLYTIADMFERVNSQDWCIVSKQEYDATLQANRPIIVKVGQSVARCGGSKDTFMICQVSAGKIMLISTIDGNRWDDRSMYVLKTHAIPLKDIEQFYGVSLKLVDK